MRVALRVTCNLSIWHAYFMRCYHLHCISEIMDIKAADEIPMSWRNNKKSFTNQTTQDCQQSLIFCELWMMSHWVRPEPTSTTKQIDHTRSSHILGFDLVLFCNEFIHILYGFGIKEEDRRCRDWPEILREHWERTFVSNLKWSPT